VVADGVGGQDLGEVASRLAIDSLLGNFRKSVGGEWHSSLLRRLVQAANHEVYEHGRSASPGGIAMATTVVACALRYDQAVVAHVGDSRCYLIRHRQATLLTHDHTVVEEQVRLGLLSKTEAAQSRNRNFLRRSLGSELFVNVDIEHHQVLPGDVLVLCSDGLHNSVSEKDIVDVPNSRDLPRLRTNWYRWQTSATEGTILPSSLSALEASSGSGCTAADLIRSIKAFRTDECP
jgi:PPM family protein phosphatase